MRKPKKAAMGTVISMAATKAARESKRHATFHSITHRAEIWAAMAPMVTAKLMPMPATMGRISASTIKAFRLRRPNSSYIT